jgi:hypothetical protein
LVEIIVAWILPIGNAPDMIVMVLVVIGQVEKIATDNRILVHRPITKIRMRKMSWIESWKSDVMLMGLQKGKSAQLRRIVSGREIHYSFYV